MLIFFLSGSFKDLGIVHVFIYLSVMGRYNPPPIKTKLKYVQNVKKIYQYCETEVFFSSHFYRKKILSLWSVFRFHFLLLFYVKFVLFYESSVPNFSFFCLIISPSLSLSPSRSLSFGLFVSLLLFVGLVHDPKRGKEGMLKYVFVLK